MKIIEASFGIEANLSKGEIFKLEEFEIRKATSKPS